MRAATPNLARKSVVTVVGFDENDSETKDSGQDNEVVQQDSGDNHEPMVFFHDTDSPILVKQVETRDDIEVEGIGPKGSINTQEMEVECDDTLRTNPALVRVTTGGVGGSDKEPSRLDFDTQLQEIDKEIAIFDSSEGRSKEGEESVNTNMDGHPTRSDTVVGLGDSIVEQRDILK